MRSLSQCSLSLRAWQTLGRLRFILLLCFVLVHACADPVEDIDRTQANLLKKSELEGEWYFLQTVIDIPPTRGFTFIGETSSLERVRWEIQEELLIAYRSYEKVRNASSVGTETPFDGKDAPIASYAIRAHVDILRDYNSSTGEQSNLIVENTQDRQWYERDYIRVDWSRNLSQSFDFAVPVNQVFAVGYFEQEEQGGPEALYLERDDTGKLGYFDVVGRLFVEPWWEGCIYAWWGLMATDCAAGEVSIRTSFAKVPGRQSYEPFHYSDQLMSRFGYFRSEYFTVDEQRGVTDAGRRYLINRHHIWEESLDEAGKPIPIEARKLRQIPYYLNAQFPDDPLLESASQETIEQWNKALWAGLRPLLGESELPPVFLLCHTPVREEDPEGCGARGFEARIGDLRYSVLHWVDEETLDGPLGYGPSAADPVTGEIISGRAYVYGSATNSYASYATDMIRWFNEQVDFESLVTGEFFAQEVIDRVAGREERVNPASALDRAPIRRPLHRHPRRRGAAPPPQRVPKTSLRRYDDSQLQRRLDYAQAAGQSPRLLSEELTRALGRASGAPWESLSEEEQARRDPTQLLNPIAMKRLRERRDAARARSIDFREMIAPDLAGMIQRYLGRSDYDEIWRELRAEIYAATAEHELGHTLGLRHNFQGSYDSLNYPDSYWALREETLGPVESLGDFYRQSTLSDRQREGLLRQQQYSSIMDYGFTWESDLQGLGKYDEAALVFGYTAGSRQRSGDRCARYPSQPSGEGCLALEPGLIQVFEKRLGALGEAGELLNQEDLGFRYDDPGLPSVNILERYHYSTVAQAFPALSDFSQEGRRYLAYADYLDDLGSADRQVRVPFLFCSDEWEGGLLSCNAFDRGADPFEMARAKIDDYRANYPFVNFRRGRVGWEVWEPLFSSLWRTFLPLSDYFQFWYVAPYGNDPVFDRSYDLAIHSGFNLLAEVLATPPYGSYCQGRDGLLVHLSEEPTLQGDPSAEPDCLPGSELLQIEPGVGRRRFSAYDPNEGYYFELKPREAGHYWTTLAAVWALVDPDAYLIGVDGDVGTYAISFYDWFGDELKALVTNLLTEDYSRFAPRAERVEGESTLQLTYPPAAPLYAAGSYFDAESGREVSPDPSAGPLAGPQGLCGACEADRDCAGHSGGLGGTFCQPIDESGLRFCLQDCTEDEDLCPAETLCDDYGNCVPEAGECAPLLEDCAPSAPLGRCVAGSSCVNGTCVADESPSFVETAPTFALSTDLLWYGFLFTTASYSTSFNDFFNVFRPGTNAEVEVDPAESERHDFVDPVSGVLYSAVQPRCDREGPAGGAQGLCGACETSSDCAGYTGNYGGVYCQPIVEGGEGYCLQDCTEDDSLCGAGERCDEVGNCVPESLSCEAPAPCSEEAPLGACGEGETCVAGGCELQFIPSARCRLLRPEDTGAVRLIKRGRTLAADYQDTLDAWYSYDGADGAEDDRRARRYFNARFELSSFVDLLETLGATYQIFGRVY